MRDFILADLGESIPANNVIIRTDALTSTTENFVVMQVIGLNPNQAWSQQKKASLQALARKDYKLTRRALIAWCANYQINLISQNSNGTDAVTLVTALQDSDTTSW